MCDLCCNTNIGYISTMISKFYSAIVVLFFVVVVFSCIILGLQCLILCFYILSVLGLLLICTDGMCLGEGGTRF